MKRLLALSSAIIFILFIAFSVEARTGTKAWVNGYIVDDNVPIRKERGEIYLPIDKIAEYYGRYAFYKDDERILMVYKPEERHSGSGDALFMGKKESRDDSENLVAVYREAPKYVNGHVYLSLSDANVFLIHTFSMIKKIIFLL